MKDLKEIFEKFNFNLTDNQCSQFDDYYRLLIETNKKFNLTAITEENEVLIKHFLDSVLPQKFFSINSSVVDVGSGAGFPGVPLKILRPDLKITLVDSLNKRIEFLKMLKNELKLDNLDCQHSRIEDFSKNNREKFDFATARAVAPLNTLVEYLLPLIKIGGKAIIYKSSKLEEELNDAKKAIEVLGGNIELLEKYNLSDFDLNRNVLIIKKIKSTPNKYPRGQNKPRINPIK